MSKTTIECAFTGKQAKVTDTNVISGIGCVVNLPQKKGATIDSGNIQSTVQKKYFIIGNGETPKQYFYRMSQNNCTYEWRSTGKKIKNVRYRDIITIKPTGDYTETDVLACMTTKYVHTYISGTAKTGMVFRSCKYAKLQKFNLFDIASRFEVLDYAVIAYDLNDGFIEDATNDFKEDAIKAIQKNRAKHESMMPWYSDVLNRHLKHITHKADKKIGNKYAK